MQFMRQPTRIVTAAGWAISVILFTNTPDVSSSPSSSANEITSVTRSYQKVNGASWETCSAHLSCDDCYSASHACHWCARDNACHAKGSVRAGGCVSGSSCETTTVATASLTIAPDDDDSRKSWSAAWETCSSHKSCVDCHVASHTCHWCEHDGACHAKGSVRGGCVTGASCGTATAATTTSTTTDAKITEATTDATTHETAAIVTTSATMPTVATTTETTIKPATTPATTTTATTPDEDPSKHSSFWETCASHASCTDCYAASYTCHWCSHDNACHAKGSVHTGCVSGASCDASPPKDSDKCSDHTSCGECTASSWGCHWCSSDESCHAVGSAHGCAVGTNCYSIDRCQRLEPERIDDGGIFSKASFQGVGPVAKGVLITMMALVLCCSTLCFGGVTFLKCAVDDLVGEPAEFVEDEVLVGEGRRQEQQYEGARQEEGPPEELEIPLVQNNDTELNNNPDLARKESGHIDTIDAAAPDGSGLSNNRNSLSMRSAVGEAASVARSRISLSSNRATPRGSSIKRMYCACQSCYLFTIVTTIVLFVVGMSYAPREPQYNVCTNALAWKSIVEGMASLKMSASFDLLISLYNPNRFEVDLSNGSGQFHHDGEYVGAFDIPKGKIAGKAISDIVVKVAFTPDKWSALSLTSEYYRGNLVLVVGGHAHVKIPGLGNYNYDAKFEDIHVNVNDPSLDDTQLCACPGWQRPILDLF